MTQQFFEDIGKNKEFIKYLDNRFLNIESILKNHLKGHSKMRKDYNLINFYKDIEKGIKELEGENSASKVEGKSTFLMGEMRSNDTDSKLSNSEMEYRLFVDRKEIKANRIDIDIDYKIDGTSKITTIQVITEKREDEPTEFVYKSDSIGLSRIIQDTKKKAIVEFLEKLNEYLEFEYDENEPSFRCLDDLINEDIEEYEAILKND